LAKDCFASLLGAREPPLLGEAREAGAQHIGIDGAHPELPPARSFCVRANRARVLSSFGTSNGL
jgi:hypothetical protein